MNSFTSHYHFFDTHLAFTTNSDPCAGEFKRIYGYFESPAQRPDINCLIEQEDSRYTVKAVSKRYSLEYAIQEDPHPDVYLSLFSPVLYEVKEYFLIHAGSLCAPNKKSLIISAPCGFGKTTNTRQLINCGFKLLSDELAPINIKSGLVHPYPRGMGVLSKNNKSIVEIQKEHIGGICEPGYVIFLTLDKFPEEETKKYLEVYLARITDDVLTAFKHINGVLETTPVLDRLFPMVRLLLEEDAFVVNELQEICARHNVPIMYTLKGRTYPPNFDAQPKLKEIAQKDAIFELSQNILNAHNSALLEETFSGSRPKMIFELAGLMNKARFFTLTVGRLSEMTRLVKELCSTNSK